MAQYARMKIGALCAGVLTLAVLSTPGIARAGEVPASASTDLDAQVGFILDHPLPESAYSKSKRCVFTNLYDSVEVLDSHHLLFRDRKHNFWLNQLRFNCRGLRKDAVLVFDVQDQSLCNQDSFRGMPRQSIIQPSDLTDRTNAFGAHCVLGDFESISAAQAAVLRLSLSRRTDR